MVSLFNGHRMKKMFLLLTMATFLFSACKTSKGFLERENEEKALTDAIKKLDKEPDHPEALEAVPVLYNSIKTRQLAMIEGYQKTNDLNRFDKIIRSYDVLQSAYTQILATPAAFKLITPESYSTQLMETKEQAAEAYYQSGMSYLNLTGRDNAKKAYDAFNRTGRYVSGYKDAEAKMEMAFQNGTIAVVVGPIRDDSYFSNNGWGSYGYNYSNEYFQDQLVRDVTRNNQPVKMYTDWQARRDNVYPDWEVNLRLRDINIPYPQQRTYTRQSSKQIENGTDTSGRPLYQTVYATVHITQRSFNARAIMEVDIRDVINRKSVNFSSFQETYRWQDETGSYTGDSRALSQADWNIINNRNAQTMRREEVLQELYRKLYPRVLNHVRRYVEW